jgi:hypothetical protein
VVAPAREFPHLHARTERMNPMLVLALLLPNVVVPSTSAAPVAQVPSGEAVDQGPTTIRETAARIAALPTADREEASAALRLLTANCPYTRAAMLLPHVLRDVLDELPPTGFDPAGRAMLATLREGLALHVAALDVLEVHVTRPGPADLLHGRPAAAIPDLASLRQSADPVAAMAYAVDQITPIARTFDAPIEARHDALSTRVEALTGVARPCPRGPWAVSPGQPWTLGMELGAARDDLERLAVHAVDPAARARLDALVVLVDAYGEAAFASDATPRR